jgi:polysaccharide export outer membrane protein
VGILNRAPWIGLAAVLLSCAPVGPYVWADDYLASAEKEPGSGYRIGVGDLISVRVFGHEGISARERVREDGKVSFPFLRDVQAAGFAPQGLAEQIQARLKDYINAPVVTVAVEETRPLTIPVLGEVVRPGQYTLERGAGMLDALASAGGLTDFAHRDRIFVVRRQSAVVRIRSTFAALSTGQGRAAMLRLQPGDCVVVE